MLTFGADIEVFLRNEAGKVVSAIGLIGGSKHEPLWVNNGNLQEDNVLAEFAIAPATTLENFKGNIYSVLDQLREKVAPLTLLIDSSAELDPSELNNEMARMFGCDPDYSAYTMKFNDAPNPDKVGNLRTAGAHLHLGYPEIDEDPFSPFYLARFMDVYLGVPSVLLDTDKRRRQVYGKAGAMRLKDYGVEYRTLSNFWIRHDGWIDWAFNQMIKAYDHFLNEPNFVDGIVDLARLQNIINNGDEEEAQKWVKEFNITIP